MTTNPFEQGGEVEATATIRSVMDDIALVYVQYHYDDNDEERTGSAVLGYHKIVEIDESQSQIEEDRTGRLILIQGVGTMDPVQLILDARV